MTSSPRAVESRSSKAERSSAPSAARAARDRRTRWCARRGRRPSSSAATGTKRGREAPLFFLFRRRLPIFLLHAEELDRVAEIDLALVGFRQLEVLDRAYALPDEHRPALGIEGAVAREHHAGGAEEVQPAAQRRGRSAEHGFAVEHAEILDRLFRHALEHLFVVLVGGAAAELRPQGL